MLVSAMTGSSASSGVTRFIEDHFLPYSCDVDEGTSCEMDHADPNRVLMKFLQRQMGVDPNLRARASETNATGFECDFQPDAPIGPPVPFMCNWELETNDAANWEPGSIVWNALTQEEGPFLGAYAISRLNSQTAMGKTSLLAPMMHSRTDVTTVALLDVDYYIRGEPKDCILSIKLLMENKERISLWSTEDNFPETEQWINVRFLEFHPPLSYQIVFESTMTPGAVDRPYVALDNIVLRSGALPSMYDCEEAGTSLTDDCGLIEVSDDNFWSRGVGATPTSGTGPSVDHTLGTADGGYLYIKSSEMSATSIASLQSVEYYKWSDQTPCTLRLYYHALGANLGSLTVRINSTQSVDLMESITLTNADDWISYDVDLSTVSGRYRIIFEATATGPEGDIALDDIEFQHSQCMGVDFCRSFPCLNGGSCTQTSQDDFQCGCAKGYDGLDCSTNIDECNLDPSLCSYDPLRLCQDKSPGYECVCKPGYMEFKGRCIEGCSNHPCTRDNETCLQNDNGFTCICNYGYIDSIDGQCIRDKSDVESGITPYTEKVLVGTYVGGFLLGLSVALLVIICHFSFCDERVDGDDRDDFVGETDKHDSETPEKKSSKSDMNGGFEMEVLDSNSDENINH
ncbi:MAM and LDL-receptor class A domain-containing protein 1-like [Asterias rubens]|uniref:MAM and LDL-receptor class A domain-containing protein 1-like n=1 Tax=Asterias rubens TaxID=7604 RepID=UPI001454EFB9|nr:MAM and LDL-receptor class A domain-containing protein 1-like [Asterias rubens]